MSQHDYTLANQSGVSFRADLNNALGAIASLNSGATDPASTFSVAYMLWADTSTGLLKIRNAANSAWVTLGTLASSYLGLITHALATAKGDILAATGSGAFAKLAVGSNGYRPEADSSQSGGIKWSSVAPSSQIFTTGSGTYTTPSGVKAIRIRMVGGGGGGSSSVTNSGSSGGNTTFGSLTAGGGGGGTVGASGGNGGTSSGGDINLVGGGGAGALPAVSGTSFITGPGGSSAFGGGASGSNATGHNAAANSGGGGSGGASSTANQFAGSGGGSGGYCEKLIVGPAATYSYSVGSGGNGGSAGGYAGGNGGSGLIIVEEFR